MRQLRKSITAVQGAGAFAATNKIATYAATDHVATPNAFSQKIGFKKAIHLSAARDRGHRDIALISSFAS
ncbi:MAG TPA: hypothetical protein VFK06_06055 [Candidatus Angelobacter sp.]|nr:hypothetical protein [Candidatus Angelobacter sp.]